MLAIPKLTRPSSFQQDGLYLRRDKTAQPAALIPVRFVAYDVCPAFVIVQNGNGCISSRRIRCPREEIYMQVPGPGETLFVE